MEDVYGCRGGEARAEVVSAVLSLLLTILGTLCVAFLPLRVMEIVQFII